MKLLKPLLAVLLILPTLSFGQVFITEIADPNNNAGARYVELYNAGGSAVNLGGWVLGIEYNTNNAGPTTNNNLTGTIAAGDFFIIADNAGNFTSAFGFAPDQDGTINSNGDDRYFLYNASSTLVDIYGVPGADGTNQCQEFEDGRAERVASVTTGNTTWTPAEWNIDSDDSSPACAQNSGSTANAPGDFDPGAWIGVVSSGPSLSTSPTVLSGFATTSGTNSASQSFDISGSDLSPASGNVVITAPADYEVSLDNSSFSANVNLAYTGGAISAIPVYVRIAASASAGSPSGSVDINGGGTSVSVGVSGTVCPAPSGNFNVGDITIIGFSSDAPDAFAFVNWVSIPNGATLFFTDNRFENGALSSNEQTVEWNNNTGSVIVPGTVIVYTNGSGFDLGTDASGGLNGLSASQDNLFVYEGTAACPEFVFGFSNNPWVTSGSASNSSSYLPSELNVTNGNITVSTQDNWQFSDPRNDQASIAAYKPLVNNASNWTGDNTNFTLSSTDFIVASANPSVEISASASSGSEAATSSITITATAVSAVSGDQTIQLIISGTGITAGDYTISNSGLITILDGQTTGTATFDIVDDADVEGNETVTISYNVGGLSSGLTAGTTTSVDLDIADNDGTVLYSQTSGGTNSAIWDIIPNGTPQPASNFGGFSEFMDVVIQNGHTVDITTSGIDIGNLTVNNGGKFYANNSSSPEYVDIYGNVVNNGTIGNGSTPDFISFNIKGAAIAFSGNGQFDAGRIRNDVAPTGSLIIDTDITLNWAGACIYNNETNSSFDLTINPGRTVTVANADGDVAIDGTDGTTGSERGGSILINGTLFVNDQIYARSNNSSLPCSIVVGGSGKIEAENILVNIDGTGFSAFTINTGGIVEVNNLISVTGGTLNSNGGLTINSGATLLHGTGTTGGGGSVTGNVNVKRQGATGVIYNHWSTPVSSGATVPGTAVFSYDSNLGTMDYSDDIEDPGWIAFSGTMQPGAGYTSRNGQLATFTGPVNDGTINYPIVSYPFIMGNPDPGTPFNLVGNPYPGAISAAALVAANSNIAGSIYFWDDDLSSGFGYSYTDYATWNGTGSIGTGGGSTPPNGNIASCQGFKVRATGTGNLTFNNNMRVAAGNNNLFFRESSERSRIWLSLEGEGVYNEILIGMLPEATDGEDRLYDAIKMRGNLNIALSAVNENRDYSILAFPHPWESKIIPLTAMVGQNGTYHFKPFRMENLEGYNVYFQDVRQEGMVLLNENTEVSVNLTEGEYINRFYIHFVPRNTTSVSEQEKARLSVYSSFGEDYLTLNGSISNGTLEILSANGQLVESRDNVVLSNTPLQLNTTSLSTGMYLVRFTSKDGQFITRFSKF